MSGVGPTLAVCRLPGSNPGMGNWKRHSLGGIRKFLWVGFSSIILAKTSVASARDIIHSRHHYYEHGEVPDVLQRFTGRVKTMRRQMQEFLRDCARANPTKVTVRSGDTRRLSIGDERVDLVFTSPPYATVLD